MTSLVLPNACLLLGILSTGLSIPYEATVIELPLELSLQQEFEEYIRTGIIGPTIKETSEEVGLKDILLRESQWQQDPVGRDPLVCTLCRSAVDNLLNLAETSDPEVLLNTLINLCVDLQISNRHFCDPLLKLMAPHLWWINEHRNLTGRDVCGMSFMALGCTTNNPDRFWEIELPDVPKPPISEFTLPEDDAPKMKVLHLADTHFDPYYKPGSNAECDEKYFCCREESDNDYTRSSKGTPLSPEAEAGNWGDFRNCDPPRKLIQAIYDQIKQAHTDIDFIIWTGDLIPHDIYNTTREGNLEMIRETVAMVVESFPGIPVFPALGNHESSPVNVYPQPYIDNEFDVHWLYDEIAQLWTTWLPEEIAQRAAYSAYYSTLIKPGLRVISVNTNYCYGYNWWVLYDDIDPGQGLGWLAKELQAAEDADEKVYLISHISPGHMDCTRTWSHQYNRITFRYESTIAGLFYAHTHNDHYELFYDPEDDSRAYHVGYIAPSQTTYSFLNPGYRIYTIDGDYESSSYQVLDHETWVLDLDEVNLTDDPRFYKLYSAKEAYDLPDLFPSTWSDMVYNMSIPDSPLFDDFYTNFIKNSTPLAEKGYTTSQKEKLLCRLLTSDNSDHSHCDDL